MYHATSGGDERSPSSSSHTSTARRSGDGAHHAAVDAKRGAVRRRRLLRKHIHDHVGDLLDRRMTPEQRARQMLFDEALADLLDRFETKRTYVRLFLGRFGSPSRIIVAISVKPRPCRRHGSLEERISESSTRPPMKMGCQRVYRLGSPPWRWAPAARATPFIRQTVMTDKRESVLSSPV
jgi:hypothetical protein